MSKTHANARRAYGSGSLFERNEQWFGKWRVGNRQIKRKLGPKRKPGTREGLTRAQAEARLRAAMSDPSIAPIPERVTIAEAGTALIQHLEGLGRKTSTIESYMSTLRIHLGPYFDGKPMSQITQHDIENFVAEKQAAGQAAKSVANYLGFLHSIYRFAERRRWVTSNPCRLVEKPRAADVDADIRFLDIAEIEALLRAVPDDHLGRVEKVMYLAAAMTGMRQGELLAVRWLDVDWSAQRVRVRRNFVRGKFGSPKSKRSSRSVPLADRLAGELDRLHQQSPFDMDHDLVFAHPHTGKPIDRSKLLKRFKAALERAKVREVRFHDLRHTFGTRMAAAGVPMRTLQEWMGHRDYKTTAIYADYAPGVHEAAWVESAFGGQPSASPTAVEEAA